MKKSDDVSLWHDRSLRFLSFRPRSRQEVKDYLVRKRADERVVNEVLRKLEEAGLIDDTEFAQWFVEQRKSFRPKGTRAIKLELLQKGVPREIIDQVLTTDLGKDQELEAARQLATKKLPIWRTLTPREQKNKVSAYLVRRGFDWKVIEKILAGISTQSSI